jgi:hypothetical protein
VQPEIFRYGKMEVKIPLVNFPSDSGQPTINLKANYQGSGYGYIGQMTYV